MKTYTPTPTDIERRWFVVDADGAVLGRLASEVAQVLRGKHKPMYAPHMDTGDHVIVVNARSVVLTGGKREQKVAYRHSGYPGGLTETVYARLLAQRPSFAVEKAIQGMLPHNRLGRAMGRKLMVYDGPEHPHAAQKPAPLGIGEIPSWNGLPEAKPKPAPKPKSKPKPKRASSATTAPSGAKRTTAKRATSKRSTAPARKASTAATASTEKAAGKASKDKAAKDKASKDKGAGDKPKRTLSRTRRAKKEE